MSEALERVIATQQKEIDLLKKREDAHIQSCIQQVAAQERLKDAVFKVLSAPQNYEYRTALKAELSAQGWCLYCETQPCECDE